MPKTPRCIMLWDDDGTPCWNGRNGGYWEYRPSKDMRVFTEELEGKVEVISLSFEKHPSDRCSSADEALVDKFGKPTSVQINDMITGLGIPAKQVEKMWELGEGLAMFSDPEGDLNTCFFLLESGKWRKHKKEAGEKDKLKF